MIKKTFYLCLLIPLAFLASCNDPDCIRVGGDQIRMNFYDLETGEASLIRINNLQVLGADSILFDGVPDVTTLILPINPAADSITAYFDTELGNDTLIIAYSSVARLISEDCGAEAVFSGINIVRSDFDSIRVINSSAAINFLEPDIVNENIQVFN